MRIGTKLQRKKLHTIRRLKILADPIRVRLKGSFYSKIEQNNSLMIALHPDRKAKEKVQSHQEIARPEIIEVFGEEFPLKDGKIEWNKDLRSGYQWPNRFYKKIDYRNAYLPGNYNNHCEIKFPIEVGRCHHLLSLAQAHVLRDSPTRNGKGTIYAELVRKRILDWMEKNPYGFGVNWLMAMDVAIRAVNWIWAYCLIGGPKDKKFDKRFFESLYLHGKYIEENLEWNDSATTNHYLADIVGLLCISLFLRCDCSEKWKNFAVKELIREMDKQVNEDGVDYEASTSYHRLVLELFYVSAILCRNNDIYLPSFFWGKLEKMFYFTKEILKDNGAIPQMGDNDSGRLLPFTKRDNLDHSYLMTVGALLFDNCDFVIDEFGYDEEADWLFGDAGNATYHRLKNRGSQSIQDFDSVAFPKSGIFVMRNRNAYMCISCGTNGQNGNGGHCHNDKLSFELRINGEDIIVDPGTYVYTSDYKARNLFRSTEYHNTIRVNGLEINEYNEKELFRMRGKGKGRLVKWESTERYDLFEGYHDGYHRLDPPVTHTRQIRFVKARQLWVITDSVYCSETDSHDLYQIESFFHFGESVKRVKISRAESSEIYFLREEKVVSRFFDRCYITKISLVTDKQECSIYISNCIPEDVDVYEGWISKRYGHRQTAMKLKVKFLRTLPHEHLFLIHSVVAKKMVNGS